MINFEHVRKRYPSGYEALRGVSFSVERGEMAFITGHSGAGKSTLLKLIALIEKPSSGIITVDDHNVSKISRRDIPYLRRQIGIIFQTPVLLNDRTVFDNVALPLIVSGYNDDEIGKRVRASLDQVNLLSREKSSPQALSGGEQQRLGIARAIVGKPKVIIADEPTGNLDHDLARDIMRLFQRLNQVGVTTLIATHDLDLIREFPNRRINLHDGAIAAVA